MGIKSDKKILFLASWYPSKENLTLGNFIQKQAELSNEIAEIDVLYAIDSDSVEEITVVDELINNVRTVIVYYPPVKSNVPFISTVIKKETYLLALRTGYKYLNTEYGLVHLNAVFPAGIFAKWIHKYYHTPYIVTVHWTGFLPSHQVYELLPFYIKRVYQSVFRSASKVLPVSHHLGQSLIDLELIEDYSVLSNVVKSDYFYPKAEKTPNSSTQRFLHISTFDDEHKNISGMLKAFSRLKKDFILHLVTEGDVLEVWNEIEKFNIPKDKCIVQSKLSVDRVGEAMREADCFVIFSNYETFSVVLAEAWTTGLPAIYSQCGGLTETKNTELGKQIQPKDENALYEALENFETSDYDSEVICEFAKQFSADFVKNDLKTQYEEYCVEFTTA